MIADRPVEKLNAEQEVDKKNHNTDYMEQTADCIYFGKFILK